MKTSVRILGAGLAISGAIVGVILLFLHAGGVTSEGWLASVCGKGGGCEQVLSSRWAYFPPLAEGAGESHGFSVPVALLGVFYFSAFAIWFGAFGWSGALPRWLNRAMLLAVSMGGVSSIGFLFLMAFVIKGVCPWCLTSHLINFAMVGTAIWSYRKMSAQGEENPPRDLEVKPVALACCLLVALWGAAAVGHRYLTVSETNRGMKAALSAIQEESGVLEMAFYGEEPAEMVIREENGAEGRDRDPSLDAAPGYRNTLVVFGDAECSACRRFHQMLETEIRPIYGSHLRVIFKHLPLSEIHPNAQLSAQALEAARVQGKFWKFLEALYERQDALAGLDYAALAASLGMDAEQFSADMESEVVRLRIEDDIRLAADLGLEGTPAVFLNSRRVSGSIRNLLGFWSGQANRLKTQRDEKGQGWNPEGLADHVAPES